MENQLSKRVRLTQEMPVVPTSEVQWDLCHDVQEQRLRELGGASDPLADTQELPAISEE